MPNVGMEMSMKNVMNVTFEDAKSLVLEAVATHRGQRDQLGHRLSRYVYVPILGWAAPVRAEILAWLVEIGATEGQFLHNNLRFRIPALDESGPGPTL